MVDVTEDISFSFPRAKTDTISFFDSSAGFYSKNFSMYAAPARSISGLSFAWPIMALQLVHRIPLGTGGTTCLWSAHALASFCFKCKFMSFLHIAHFFL